MIIAVPTVQHSGTHLLFHHLLRNIDNRPPHRPDDQIADCLKMDVKMHCHFGGKYWERFNEIVKEYNAPTIIPLRRLCSIQVSWERREKDLNNLRREIELLVTYKGDYYLPLDHAEKDDYLNQINKGLGLDISTDWPMKGSVKHSRNAGENLVLNTDFYLQMKSDFGSFFEDFYGRNEQDAAAIVS